MYLINFNYAICLKPGVITEYLKAMVHLFITYFMQVINKLSGYMALKDMHKQCLSDECTGSPPPTKKVKGTVRRSHRIGKGSGGAADQLQKIGNVITTVQSKKTQDIFKDAREELNLMAPKSPTKRVKKVQTLWGWTC